MSLIMSRFKMSASMQIILIKFHGPHELRHFLPNTCLFGILRHEGYYVDTESINIMKF
jgi:hypothetical protein